MSKIEVDTIAPQSGTTVTLGESGDTVNIPSGVTLTNSGTATGFGISWQSDIKTSAFTAVAGEGYWVNTTSAAITVTLPASASVGDTIEFSDYARTWDTNPVTLNQNGLNFQGFTTPNPLYIIPGQSVKIVYSGATQGWIPTSDDDVSNKSTVIYNAEYLVVAGGGSGGTGDGAGAGGGGFLTNYGTGVISLTAGEVYTATVGAGGAGVTGSPRTPGNNGTDSLLSGTGISTINAIGGGGGSASLASPAPNVGSDGGSGGGAGSGGSGGSGTIGQGFDGGDTIGGGGGASEVGGDGPSSPGNYGGDGLSNSITGSATYYAGGGGGKPSGPGGLGGGTDGVTNPASSGNSPANSGGGSGGANDNPSGNGGSGVVILRLATARYSGTTTGSPTVTTDGTDTIIKFTGSGTYTA